MDLKIKWIVIGALVLVVLFLVWQRSGGEFFKILGSAYRLDEGGNRSETQDECLQSPEQRFCQMQDGTPGICMLSGQCTPTIMQDLREERDEMPSYPYCTEPIFKSGCQRFCGCKKMAFGDAIDVNSCIDECENWFSPL